MLLRCAPPSVLPATQAARNASSLGPKAVLSKFPASSAPIGTSSLRSPAWLLCWTSAGPLGDFYWTSVTSTGPLLDLSWTSNGPLLDLYWASAGPRLDLDWTSPGPLLDLYWTSTGPPLDLYWASYWASTEHRLDLYMYWASAGPLLGRSLIRRQPSDLQDPRTLDLCWASTGPPNKPGLHQLLRQNDTNPPLANNQLSANTTRALPQTSATSHLAGTQKYTCRHQAPNTAKAPRSRNNRQVIGQSEGRNRCTPH